jgi:hypothetical protein
MSKMIQLTKGKVAIVDDKDYPMVSRKQWHTSFTGGGENKYPHAKTTNSLSMARFLMNPPTQMMVDHINHDTLDNRRSNLRICTNQENAMNSLKYNRKTGTSSNYKGVSYDKKKRKWHAYIQTNGHQRHLGYFVNQEEAARSYDLAAKRYFKEYSLLNFVETLNEVRP